MTMAEWRRNATLLFLNFTLSPFRPARLSFTLSISPRRSRPDYPLFPLRDDVPLHDACSGF